MDVLFLRNTILNIKKRNNTELILKNMDREATIEQLKNIIKPYAQNEEAFENLTEDTDFINDLKINSANLVDVILDIEEKFDLIIDNESMEKMVNVKAAIGIIEAELSKK